MPDSPDAPNDRTSAAAWLAGVSAFFLIAAAASGSPDWPAAITLCFIAAMVAAVCFFILRPRK